MAVQRLAHVEARVSPTQHDIERVMRDTGMGYLQARAHLIQRRQLAERAREQLRQRAAQNARDYAQLLRDVGEAAL